MSCHDCTEAESRAGHWHQYHNGCLSCQARAVARSTAAFNAIKHGDAEDLRDMLKRMFPTIPYSDARAMVWKWWQIDHKSLEKTS